MMCGHYAVLSSNYDIYFDLWYTKVYTLPLNSQEKEVLMYTGYQFFSEMSKIFLWRELCLRFYLFYSFYLKKRETVSVFLNIFF